MAEGEAAILKTNERKQAQHQQMQAAMRAAINKTHELAISDNRNLKPFRGTKKLEAPSWLSKSK
jgi:hypothetical protein